MPEAWEQARDLDPEVRGFYAYHAALMEPWDGPAGLIFTDGVGVGAALDRNGLRPLRYADVRGRPRGVLRPRWARSTWPATARSSAAAWARATCSAWRPSVGLVRNHEVKAPAGRGRALRPLGRGRAVPPRAAASRSRRPPADLLVRQLAHGYTKEELAMVLKPMADDAYEPTFSMGDDSPLATLAGRARPVAHFLRQRFAQVTNPPIDPLRERRVMSLRVLLGPARAPARPSSPTPPGCSASTRSSCTRRRCVGLSNPASTRSRRSPFDATFAVADGPGALRAAAVDGWPTRPRSWSPPGPAS